MYNAGTLFESDLINSYAWDTAIIFLQTFDNRVNKNTLKVYSRQNSLNDGNLATQGTNKLTDINVQDKICNVYDMASNCLEWSTETSSRSGLMCTNRGGGQHRINEYYTSIRNSDTNNFNSYSTSFRPILYL